MSIIDVCTFNGEQELWDLHYNVLKDVVDEFIVIEFDKTFSGQDKSPSFEAVHRPKVTYKYHTLDDYAKYRDLALGSPNTQGASHWKMEFMQKESLKDALTHLKDDDLVFIGDVDEIWNPDILDIVKVVYGLHPDKDSLLKLRLDVYTYWLNNRSSEEFWGTIVAPYARIKDKCLNHLRSDNANRTQVMSGWHFTSMGGYEALKKKLSDSYTEETYNSQLVQHNLHMNLISNLDFLGRPFTYTQDESQWPQYLIDNKEKYSHLCTGDKVPTTQ